MGQGTLLLKDQTLLGNTVLRHIMMVKKAMTGKLWGTIVRLSATASQQLVPGIIADARIVLYNAALPRDLQDTALAGSAETSSTASFF